MAVPMFFAGGGNWVEEFALGCLAVAGGYLAGYVGGGFAGWAIDRWVFKKPSPEPVRKLVRIVCGIGVALLVFWIVFHNRGTGGGTGDGQGKGSGSPTDATGKGDPPKAADKRPPEKAVSPKPADVDPTAQTLQVTVLGGAAADGDKLYRFPDDQPPLALGALKERVLQERSRAGRPVLLLVAFPVDPNHQLPANHPTVTALTGWATAQGIRWEFLEPERAPRRAPGAP